jgi:hypothetical protein
VIPSSNLPCIAHAEGKGQDAATVREVCHCIAGEIGNSPVTAVQDADLAAAYDERRLKFRNLQVLKAFASE